jgi:hypothetical protein
MSLFHNLCPSTAHPPTQIVAVQFWMGLSPVTTTSTEVWVFKSQVNFLPIALGHTIEVIRNREDVFMPMGD